LGQLLPRFLHPVYTNNVYQYLRHLPLIEVEDFEGANLKDYAYIYVLDDIYYSPNLKDLIDLDVDILLTKFIDECGEFYYKDNAFYYCNLNENKFTFTNANYINEVEYTTLSIVLPATRITVAIVCAIIIGIVYYWTIRIFKRIEMLKQKIDHLDSESYSEIKDDKRHVISELNALSDALDDMRITFQNQEEYRNQVFQSISHDFKTPLAVVKSHIEALEDGMLKPGQFENVIKTQLFKLEYKVNSLLYLNKLNYITDLEKYRKEKFDIRLVIDESSEKFKFQRPEIEYKIHYSGNTEFRGNEDAWEAIIDNLLNNFMRYAKKEIHISVIDNELIIYNDGPSIDENILNDAFTPYKKGVNGVFGLGLAIVKRTVNMLGYEVTVQNETKGITFMIK